MKDSKRLHSGWLRLTVLCLLMCRGMLSLEAYGAQPEKDFSNIADVYLGFGSFHSDLSGFNNSLPAGFRKVPELMPSFGGGLTFLSRKYAYNMDFAFSSRHRSIFSDYEQIYTSRSRFSLGFGRHLYASRKNHFFITPLIGFSFDQLSMKYRNDSIGKTPSIPWVVNNPFPRNNQDEEDQDRYINPSMAALAQLRITAILAKKYTLAAQISYQHDLGSGKWHYGFGFVRSNSPATFTTGFYFNISAGFNFSELEE